MWFRRFLEGLSHWTYQEQNADGPSHGRFFPINKESNGSTIAILRSYVDDCLFAGNLEFNDVINKNQKRFESKPVEWDNTEFLGVKIVSKNEDNKAWFKWTRLNTSKSYSKFRPMLVSKDFGPFGQAYPGCATLGLMYAVQWTEHVNLQNSCN